MATQDDGTGTPAPALAGVSAAGSVAAKFVLEPKEVVSECRMSLLVCLYLWVLLRV